MKTKITLVLALIVTFCATAQQGVNYKALIKDGTGNVVASQLVTVQFSILQGVGLTNVYQETHTPMTDANGIIIVNIGEGTPVSGVFSSIGWASDTHSLKTEIDTGSGLVDMGMTQFKAVPYALSALTSSDNYWTKNGSNVFNENEKIGIGTTTPTGKVEISYASGTINPQLTLTDLGGNYSRINFKSSTSPNYWAVAGYSTTLLKDGRFNIWNGSTDIVSITGDGIVGVTGAIDITSSVYGLRVISAVNNGVHVISAGNDGLYVSSAGAHGVSIGTATGNGIDVSSAVDGVYVNTATDDGIQVDSAGNNGVVVTSANDNGIAVIAAGNHGLIVSSAGGDGARITSADDDGIYIGNAGNDGVHVTSADDIGGFFKGTNTGVHAVSSNNSNPDLILGGTANTTTGDDGIIASDPSYTGSDIFLRSNDAVIVELDADNNESGQFQIRDGLGSAVFEVLESGIVKQNGSTIHASDKRLKRDISSLSYGLDEILQLQPKTYNWKNRDQKHKSLGLIAQEVAPIIKEIVVAQDNPEKTLGISYTELIPVLIKAIQEQQNIIDSQQSEIKSLASELTVTKEVQKTVNKRLKKVEETLNISQ